MSELIIRKAADDLRDNTIGNLVRKAGLRGKIEAKCIECIYDPYQQGTWRFQVENCTSPDRSLYEARPTTLTSSKGGN